MLTICINSNLRQCRVCKEFKPLTDFPFKVKSKGWRKHTCQICINEYQRQYWRDNNLAQSRKQWSRLNLEKDRKYKKTYRDNHKSEALIYQKLRRATDMTYRLTGNLRHRLGMAIRGQTKSASTLKLLGCPIEKLKEHLESKFSVGMTWENYGRWHIDHIRPIASFDLSQPEKQQECFHYENLQPLWAQDNLIKGDKLV